MNRLLLAAFLIAGPCSANAAELPSQSKIASVTVFPTGAEVTRLAEVSLSPGSHIVIIQDLPADIVENSVRVEGEMSGDVEIASVDTKRIFIKKPGAPDVTSETERRRLEAEIEKQRDERAALDGIIESANTQKTLAQNLAKLPVSAQANSPSDIQSASDWTAIFDLIAARFEGIQKAILEAQIKQREIDRQIKALEQQLNREPPEETERTEVKIFLEAAAAAKGSIRILYRTNEAGWEPAYDARVVTGDKGAEPRLMLVRRARVMQDTGEDWDDVSMTLSTARLGESTAPPDIRPVQVDFQPEPKPLAGHVPPPAPAAEFRSKAQEKDALDKRRETITVKPVIEKAAAIESSAYQALFKIASKVTVKTGMGAKKILIASETLKPSIKIITIPVENTAAFINAHFTYQGEAPILPGEAALYRDNVFIGTTQLPLIASGEEYDLGLGVDDAVKVNRISVKREKGETGVITSSNTDEQHFRITVKNLHDHSAPVTVIDQMPYSEDEKIVVEMLPMTTQPVETNHDDKRGVLAWDLDVKPGEEKTINLSYQITWPAKREVLTIER